MIQFQEIIQTDGRTERQMEGWKDKQTRFHRALLATTEGPKIPKTFSNTLVRWESEQGFSRKY